METVKAQNIKQMPYVDNSPSLWKVILRYKFIYIILLPGLIYFAIFSYTPMYGIQLAFKDFMINKGIWGSDWIGFEKFRLLVSNREFWSAFKNTLIISIMKTGFGFPIPIILAVLINELKSTKLKRTLQTVYTFPHFLSWVILSGIMINLLGNEGAINNIITAFGGQRAGFMVEPGAFRGILVFTDIWKESGWNCIMYLAAIASINPELYEVATIDGANRWHKAIYITWPGIRDMAAILLILAIGNSMNGNFDQVFNMYNPAVFSTGDIIDTYVYRITFQLQADYGFSTAVGLFKGVINFVLLVTANNVVKRLGQSSIV